MQGIIGFIPSCGSEKDFQKFPIIQPWQPFLGQCHNTILEKDHPRNITSIQVWSNLT